ncbi:hypothetical protein TNIN_52231 [Trichonephila inaurata madagascariensis]|uniref:Uncharacterized protein n=1 Tax=Trichonephila inaurata madagascariensis TaxID=2747483 RepID=A0A8X6WQ35_9ARAC|nr:hypothetical protein TNIN_52231 [Trichonephila inaurata madagascariensis]
MKRTFRSQDYQQHMILECENNVFSPHNGHERSEVDALLATLPLQATQISSLGLAMFMPPSHREEGDSLAFQVLVPEDSPCRRDDEY